MDLEKLKELLEAFKTDVKAMIDTKSKEQSDASGKEVLSLKEKLASAEKGLEEIKAAIKKPFGMPGVEQEKQKFSWAKFFVGLSNDFRVTKGHLDASAAKHFWDTVASFERTVCTEYSNQQSKDYNASDGSSGGFLVPPQIYQGDVIDVVYANTAILKMPVLKFTNLKGDMPIPVDNGHLTSYSLGETEAPTKSSATFKLEWLRPKKIGTYVRVSNRLLDQTNNAIEMIVKGKMALDASVELSRCLTNGKGADSEGKGILQFYSAMTGQKSISTNGKRFSIDDLASMKQALAVANELRDTNTYGTIMHPSALWGMLRETVEMYSSQTNGKGANKMGKLLLDKTVIQEALKLSIEDTTQIPMSTVGTSTTSSKVITGDWSKFVYASFRDPIFRVSDVASDASGRSALLNDELFMVMFLEYDCNCLRPAAFCGRDGAETAEASW
jgi:HK97 family phage major capsid protein